MEPSVVLLLSTSRPDHPNLIPIYNKSNNYTTNITNPTTIQQIYKQIQQLYNYNCYFFKIIKIALSKILIMNPGVLGHCPTCSSLSNLHEKSMWPHFLSPFLSCNSSAFRWYHTWCATTSQMLWSQCDSSSSFWQESWRGAEPSVKMSSKQNLRSEWWTRLHPPNLWNLKKR